VQGKQLDDDTTEEEAQFIERQMRLEIEDAIGSAVEQLKSLQAMRMALRDYRYGRAVW
jgi:hypothetical protein